MAQDSVPLLQNMQVNPKDLESVFICEEDVELGMHNYDLRCYARVHSLRPFPLSTLKDSIAQR